MEKLKNKNMSHERNMLYSEYDYVIWIEMEINKRTAYA